MRQNPMRGSENKEYIESDRWRCDKSPSGAHYWIIRNDHSMNCKYCHCDKDITAARSGWTKPEVK